MAAQMALELTCGSCGKVFESRLFGGPGADATVASPFNRFLNLSDTCPQCGARVSFDNLVTPTDYKLADLTNINAAAYRVSVSSEIERPAKVFAENMDRVVAFHFLLRWLWSVAIEYLALHDAAEADER